MNEPIFGTSEQRTPVLYALVRFRPFAETGEFANVGVIACCPSLNTLDYRMQSPNVKRVIDFFDKFSKDHYKAAIKDFEIALRDIKQLGQNLNGNEKLDLFKEFIHPREALMTFSEYSVVMSENPKGELDRIFDYYIRQNFDRSISQEHRAEQEIRAVIQRLGKQFVPKRIGTNGVDAEFPFVQTQNDVIKKIIKPLYLGQKTVNDIYRHGDIWVGKIRRIRHVLPNETLFSIDGNSKNNAVQEICNELAQHDIIVQAHNTSNIELFALQ